MRVLMGADGTANGVVAQTARFANADSKLNLTSLGNLLTEPEEKVTWVLDGVLPAGGLSLMAGKPKAGKSTFARCLALAVAQGQPFLNRATAKGAVLYLALEEKRSEVRKHFQALGATDKAIFIHADRAPVNALMAAQRAIKQHNPALVIIDPLLKFARVKDTNDYAQVTAALEPLLALARESGAHVLLVYHATKSDKADPIDAANGSTAFGAGVDTLLVLKRTERYRTLLTVQRYGADLPQTVLDFDSERRAVLLGVEKSEADTKRTADAILEHMAAIDGHITEAEIGEAVEGKTTDKRTALRQLVEAGTLRKEGNGKKGDPYRYCASEKCSFPCSQHIPGTRKQESERTGYPAENTSEMLVPANLGKSGESSESREQESRPDLLPGIAPFSYPD
jgi:hypothetical protein